MLSPGRRPPLGPERCRRSRQCAGRLRGAVSTSHGRWEGAGMFWRARSICTLLFPSAPQRAWQRRHACMLAGELWSVLLERLVAAPARVDFTHTEMQES